MGPRRTYTRSLILSVRGSGNVCPYAAAPRARRTIRAPRQRISFVAIWDIALHQSLTHDAARAPRELPLLLPFGLCPMAALLTSQAPRGPRRGVRGLDRESW